MKAHFEGGRMPDEIALRPGTEFVDTAEIPALIAEAIYPEAPDEPRLVTQLTKTAKPVAEGEPYGWPTTIDDDDRKILEGFWTGLPPLVLSVTEEKFRPYLEAFKEKGNALDWELTCVIVPANAASRRAAERKHSQALVSAIRRKQLLVLTPDTRIQADEYQCDSIVTVDELSRYAARFNIDVRVEATTDGDAPAKAKVATLPASSQSGDEWIEKARAIADRIGLEKYIDGVRKITARGICDAVATDLALDETTWGLQGARGADNVRIEGLRGWKFDPLKKVQKVD